MGKYGGHVVSVIEKADLDQVVSSKRLDSRWGPLFGVVFARRASPCSSLPTLPEAASAVLASSPGDGCCFRFLLEITVPIPRIYSFVQIHINLILYLPGTWYNVRNVAVQQVGSTP